MFRFTRQKLKTFKFQAIVLSYNNMAGKLSNKVIASDKENKISNISIKSCLRSLCNLAPKMLTDVICYHRSTQTANLSNIAKGKD